MQRQQREHEHQLDVQPNAGKPLPEPEPHPEDGGEHYARHHDAEVQPALHDLEAFQAERIFRHGVIDEKARQLEKAGVPGHHEDDVERLDPEHLASGA
jgi:hypothetical protein